MDVSANYCILTTCDCLLACIIFFPSTCCFWRGSWDLIGYYVLPNNTPLNFWVMTIVGCCYSLNFMALPILDRYLERDRKVLYFIVTRLFLYYHALFYMFMWRGVWELFNHYLGTDWKWSFLHLAIALIFMILIRCLRSTTWPPLFIFVDTRPNLLKASTRFKVNPDRTLLYFLDSMFSAVVITIFGMLSWRSVMNIMDGIIYPSEPIKADCVCAIFGALGIILLFLCQFWLAQVSVYLSRKPSILYRLAWEDTCYLVLFVFLTALWRGVWNLNTRYFINELPLGGWVNHGVGALLLLVTQTLSYVAAFGVIIDGEEEEGGAFFPTMYLRYYLGSSMEANNFEINEEPEIGVFFISCNSEMSSHQFSQENKAFTNDNCK